MAVVQKAIDIGINSFFAIQDYKGAREQGDNKAVSVAKAGGSFLFGEMVLGSLGLPGVAAYIGATVVPQLATATATHTTQTMTNAYASRGKFGSGHFNMTEAGYTMRQRSLNAIRSNGLNTQSVLGNEARTYFRSSL